MVALLAAMVGLLALARSLHRSAAASAKDLATPQFTTMAFGELPDWVAQRLAGLRDQFIALGFREIATYTRKSRRLNYTCTLVAPDEATTLGIWIGRSRGLMLWVVGPLLGWSAFKQELLASPRFGLTTHFPGARLFETTPVGVLARAHVDGQMEFSVVPETMAFTEMIERHREGMQAFAAKCGAQPIRIAGVKDLLECERDLSIRLAENVKRKLSR